MITRQATHRLLAGPPLDGLAETYTAHLARLGALPRGPVNRELIAELEASGLLGRGGAGFPVGRKLRAMAERHVGRAVVLVNGAEGEIASAKDRVLLAHRPHLVIDGAVLAAEAIGADEIIFYIGTEHDAAVRAVAHALRERDGEVPYRLRLVRAPEGYVAGEATAAVNYVNTADARPRTSPPRPSTSGVGCLPTLVQNVESLAHVALIARFGEGWYRSAGHAACGGTALITVTGGAVPMRVQEIELGTVVGDVAASAGATPQGTRAVLLGGYFGTWASVEDVWAMPLDPEVMRDEGLAFGCGMLGLLASDRCGVEATAEIMEFMARASAAQCGPCTFGLRSIAEAATRVAVGAGSLNDLDDIERWLPLVEGRGACHHPDGAAQLMASALRVFGDEFERHARTGWCAQGRERRHAG